MTLTMNKLRIFLIKKLNYMIKINYNIDEDKWNTNFPHHKKYISKTVNETLNVVNTRHYKNLTVNFLLTSNNKIKVLNSKYRKKEKSTNVLSFPMKFFHDDCYVLGDIALANQTLLKEALEQKIKKYDYLCKLTIHGMLHLLGYDHKTEKQYKKMNKFEDLIYKAIKRKS